MQNQYAYSKIYNKKEILLNLNNVEKKNVKH